MEKKKLRAYERLGNMPIERLMEKVKENENATLNEYIEMTLFVEDNINKLEELTKLLNDR